MLTYIAQDKRYDLSFLTTIFWEVSHERRTGRNRDDSTEGCKQDQEIYTNRLSMCWDGFYSTCGRHGHSEAVGVIGTSQPQSWCWTSWVQLPQPSAIAAYAQESECTHAVHLCSYLLIRHRSDNGVLKFSASGWLANGSHSYSDGSSCRL